ncbi:pentapeptide repeat-containing protein [Streptomyces sp. NPDC004610]|uniref:pentapeptide repeat-containing protein n=1 Tax=unclassified Streptomyces TaxID=2593676 RepID=UPI0033BD009D
MIASLVAVAGLWYSNVQTQQANEQAQQANAQAREDRELAKEGQITDRYTAAVGNLGEDKMDVRLGGIYALQRIMQDSPRDQPSIANVLAAFIRVHAAEEPETSTGTVGPPEDGIEHDPVPVGLPDAVAAFDVLTTRDPAHDEGPYLSLTSAYLAGAELHTGAQLDNADLVGAVLYGATMAKAHLAGATLSSADLTLVNLSEADLSGSILIDTNFYYAALSDADLTGAMMQGGNLSGASLLNADLREASLIDADLNETALRGTDLRDTDVTEAQLLTAVIDSSTRLPPHLAADPDVKARIAEVEAQFP